jgi:hypothetical protein
VVRHTLNITSLCINSKDEWLGLDARSKKIFRIFPEGIAEITDTLGDVYHAMALDKDDNIYVVNGHIIGRIKESKLKILAGNSERGLRDGISPTFDDLGGIVVDKLGNIYLTEVRVNLIRMISAPIGWSKETHHLFSKETRKQIFTMKVLASGKLSHKIPDEILSLIFNVVVAHELDEM